MNRGLALLFVVALSGGAGLAGAACSSSSDNGGGGEEDASASDGSGGGDANADVAHDAIGFDSASDGGGGDGGIVGNCSPVKGACDIVKQDCPQGQECVVKQGPDGGFVTGCANTQVSETHPKGAPCCPGQSNPCLPGLECLGSACVDGSAPSARCSPHCCMGDDSLCGSSPEGFPGHCDLTVSSGGSPSVDLYSACTYSAACKPLGVVPCPTNFTCIVSDPQGTASCVGTYAADAATGYGEGHGCTYANNCQDGLNCIGIGDAGFQCVMLCLVPGSNPPFDAGALDGGPGHGGCTGAKKCYAATNIFPPWLGVCQ